MKLLQVKSPTGRTRQIGRIEGNKFISMRKWEQHYFRKYDGFGFNLSIIKALIEQGITEIILIVDKNGEKKTYKTTPALVFTNGIEYHNVKDVGDTQLILPIVNFEVIE